MRLIKIYDLEGGPRRSSDPLVTNSAPGVHVRDVAIPTAHQLAAPAPARLPAAPVGGVAPREGLPATPGTSPLASRPSPPGQSPLPPSSPPTAAASSSPGPAPSSSSTATPRISRQPVYGPAPPPSSDLGTPFRQPWHAMPDLPSTDPVDMDFELDEMDVGVADVAMSWMQQSLSEKKSLTTLAASPRA